MIEIIGLDEAQEIFLELPVEARIFTVSPRYVEIDARRDLSLEPIFFLFREGTDFWLHSFLRGGVQGTPFSDLQSPYGYGGPLSNSSNREFIDRAWSSWEDWCRTHGILVEFVRFHPMLSNWKFYGGVVLEDRQTVFISLTSENLLAGYELRCRTAVRKAIKDGVEAQWIDFSQHVAVFADYYRTSMTAIGADPYYLFDDKYFDELAKLSNVRLLVCRKDDVWLSAGLFLQSELTMEYHLSATSSVGRKKGATNLLLHHAAETAKRLGCESLYLGGGTNRQKDNPLLFFKAGFSLARATYCIGYKVHLPDEYADLQRQYLESGQLSSRILFYR